MSLSALFNPLLSSQPGIQNSVFTNYGYDPRGNNELGTMFSKYGAYLYPGVSQELQYALGMVPQQQQALSSYLDSLGQAGQNAEMNSQINASNEQYNQNALQAGMNARASGLGDGFQAGLYGGQGNAAAGAANQIRGYYASPQHKQQSLQAMMQAFNQGMSTPLLGTQMSLFSPIEERHRQNVAEQGSGSALGGVLGSVGSLFGSGALSGLLGSKGNGDLSGDAYTNRFGQFDPGYGPNHQAWTPYETWQYGQMGGL